MDKIKNFRDLKIWQLGMEIVIDIYKSTRNYPKLNYIPEQLKNGLIEKIKQFSRMTMSLINCVSSSSD